MEAKLVQKVYPTPEELSSVCSKVICSQGNCKAVFQSSSNLNMHLIKHHKVPNNGLTAKKAEMQYYCPILMCPYYKDSKKHFTKFKYIKQHFLKVHALKHFLCKKCGKKFSTESFRNSHTKICGKFFTCVCGSKYTSTEAIMTHCKRKGKGHSVLEINKNHLKKKEIFKGENDNLKKTNRIIYPKLPNDVSFPVHYIAAVALSELSAHNNLSKVIDKGVQTDLFESSFNNNNNIKTPTANKKRKNSQQTQTLGKLKKLKISTETQTSIDFLRQKSKINSKPFVRKRKKSMETQTKGDENMERENQVKAFQKSNHQAIVKVKSDITNSSDEKNRKWLWDNNFFSQKDVISSKRSSSDIKSEIFNISTELSVCDKELDLNLFNNISKSNNSQYGTDQETGNPIFDKLCNIETQTEIDTFLTECNEDTTFTLCSTTETQTTADFDSLLYSNMCTQTCEEVDQLFNFNFVHIETQTTWPDLKDCSDLES